MTADLSPRGRAANIARMSAERLDILVVGGGVVGAAVAWDAALRGLRTGLVERGDFGSGTSGKTSRLIHGGLRYLRSARLGLVREAIRERDLLVRSAPALVRPIRFTIPSYRGRGPGPWTLRLGLFLYDILSRDNVLTRHGWKRPTDIATVEPRLRRQGLRAAGVYYDARTDDVRLVLAVVRAAAAAGAIVANHTEVLELFRTGGHIRGARARDRVSDRPFDVEASVVVNATGVWIDRLRGRTATRTVRPTKGVHVFVPRERIGNHEGCVLTSPRDGRVLFVIPWGPLDLVGTTDTDYETDWDRVVARRDEVDYLLEALNDAFPGAELRIEDVVSAYAGLRPLLQGSRRGANESDISRAHSVFEDPDGLVSIAGGKLTTMRAMAEDVVDLVCARLGRRVRCSTKGAVLGATATPGRFAEMGFDMGTAVHLASRHAPEDVEASLTWPGATEPVLPGLPYVWVEVSIAVQCEMATTLPDVLVRRLGIFYEAPDQGLTAARPVAERLATYLGWDEDRIREEVSAYERLVAEHRAFRTEGGTDR